MTSIMSSYIKNNNGCRGIRSNYLNPVSISLCTGISSLFVGSIRCCFTQCSWSKNKRLLHYIAHLRNPEACVLFVCFYHGVWLKINLFDWFMVCTNWNSLLILIIFAKFDLNFPNCSRRDLQSLQCTCNLNYIYLLGKGR